MTRVNKIRGSMEVFKGSHNLGFINPKYKNKKSTYPEIDKKFLNSWSRKINSYTFIYSYFLPSNYTQKCSKSFR